MHPMCGVDGEHPAQGAPGVERMRLHETAATPRWEVLIARFGQLFPRLRLPFRVAPTSQGEVPAEPPPAFVPALSLRFLPVSRRSQC